MNSAGGTVTEHGEHGASGHRWYSRPVLFVADLNRSLRFYLDQLGFVKNWHSGDGTGTVCQVSRSECEIILCQDGSRRDKARLFIELTAAGLADFRRELADRSVPSRETWWGYDSIQIDDPDGNELLFPVPE
jgi:catechol 2,3-dioxygenase-like lactoylglutathione lyase family enzyme